MAGEEARIPPALAEQMLRLPGHSVVLRLPDQKRVSVKHQDASTVDDSTIVIKMLAAGVCGTDLAILSGARPGQAEILGHEGVGVVAYAPQNCGLSKGTRLIINPVHQKDPHIVIGHSRDGIFREWFCLAAADADEGGFLVSCPRDCLVGDLELALAEPVASALYSLELIREKRTAASLLIRGSGTMGILTAKLWSVLTGRDAILVSKSEAHARWLREHTHWPANVHICWTATLPGLLGERVSSDLKAAILCCSREDAPEGLGLLLDTVQDGATINLMAGFPADYRESRLGDVPLDGLRWNNIRGVNSAPPTAVVDRRGGKTVYLVGHRGTAEHHVLHAVDLLSRGVISLADVPHRPLTLDELPGAVAEMLSSNAGRAVMWVKAMVAFSQRGWGEFFADC